MEDECARRNVPESSAPQMQAMSDVPLDGVYEDDVSEGEMEHGGLGIGMEDECAGRRNVPECSAPPMQAMSDEDDVNFIIPSKIERCFCFCRRCRSSGWGDCLRLCTSGSWLPLGFYKLGIFVARYPKTVVILALLVTGLCSIGFLNFENEDDDSKLFNPQNSKALVDRGYVEIKWPGYVLFQQYYVVSEENSGENVLTKEGLQAMLELVMNVSNVGAADVNIPSYQDLCVQTVDDRCFFESVLQIWEYNPLKIALDDDIAGTITAAVEAEQEEYQDSRILRLLGGVTTSNSSISGAAATLMVTGIDLGVGSTLASSEERVDNVSLWESEVRDATVRFSAESSVIDVYPDSKTAVGEEAGSALSGDLSKLAAGFLLLIVYGAFVMSRGNLIDSQSFMAVWAIVSVVLALAGSYGLCSAFGVKFNQVTSTLTFLAAGIGMDDAFVILRNYVRVDPKRELDITKRIGKAMASGGASICVTSLTDFVVFLTGVFSSLPAIQSFSIYAALAIVFDLIFQATFFVAFLRFDAGRQEAGRGDCSLCFYKPKRPRGRHCGCSKAEEYQATDLGIVDIVIGKYLPRILLTKLGKIITICTCLGLAAFTTYGATQLQTDFKFEWFIPKDSPLSEVIDIRNEWFGEGTDTTAQSFYMYTKEGNYAEDWQQLKMLSQGMRDDEWVDALSVDSWFDAYAEWLTDTDTGCSQALEGSDVFYTCLESFLSDERGMRYAEHIQFSNATTISATRIPARFIQRENDPEKVASMLAIREVEKKGSAFDAFAYQYFMISTEGAAVIRWQTVRSLLISSIFVCIMTFALLANILGACIVFLHVVLVDMALLAFLWTAGYTFNSVTSIVIVLAVGLSVDYSVHIVYAFMEAQGTDRNQRAQEALLHIGSVTFHGGITTWLSVSVLCLADSYVFKMFFFSFSIIVLFALFYGLILVPVLLSLFGPSAIVSSEKYYNNSSSSIELLPTEKM